MRLSVKTLLIALLSSVILNASASVYFAMGEYLDWTADYNRSFPLLVQSIDGGKTWEYETFPGEDDQFEYTEGGDCGDSICIIIARPSEGAASTVLQSQDGGKSWKKINFDDMGNNARFTNVFCEGNFCILNDGYALARTLDGGNTWSTVDLGAFFPNTPFNHLTCQDNYCVAMAFQESSDIMIHSFDAGATWSQISLDSSINRLNLHDIACDVNSNTCIAIGMRFGEETYVPLVIQSNANKSVWTEVSLAYPKGRGELWHIDCDEIGCVAAGFAKYHDGLLVQLNTKGSWEFEIISEPKSGVSLSSVGCNSTYCVVLGDAEKEHFTPIVLSNASGEWVKESIPEKVESGSLNAVRCDNTLCFIVGRYKGYSAPLILQSIQASPWKIKKVSNVPDNYQIEPEVPFIAH